MKNFEKTPGGGLSTIPSPTQKANIYNAKSAINVGVYKLAILHASDEGLRVGVGNMVRVSSVTRTQLSQ